MNEDLSLKKLHNKELHKTLKKIQSNTNELTKNDLRILTYLVKKEIKLIEKEIEKDKALQKLEPDYSFFKLFCKNEK